MKVAVSAEDKKITAAADAPEQTLCPLCGHPVVLRKRRLMNDGGCVYYWRHRAGGALSCEARSRSVIDKSQSS